MKTFIPSPLFVSSFLDSDCPVGQRWCVDGRGCRNENPAKEVSSRNGEHNMNYSLLFQLQLILQKKVVSRLPNETLLDLELAFCFLHCGTGESTQNGQHHQYCQCPTAFSKFEYGDVVMAGLREGAGQRIYGLCLWCGHLWCQELYAVARRHDLEVFPLVRANR